MKKQLIRTLVGSLITLSLAANAQQVQEYVSNTSKDKIRKGIQITQKPVVAGGFGDGHGRNPVLTNRSQVPDTIGIISLYINDFGTVKEGPYSISSYWISPDGGNQIANTLVQQVMAPLKEAFRKQGVVLLDPTEYLNTPAKRKYYYDTFTPKVSRLAKFLSNIETKHVDTSVGADFYRPFDISVCWDAIRAESLVNDLGKNLGLKGMLTVAFNMQTDARTINMLGIRMALNGPNPIPKEDKKYVAQNMGNGYYFGQIYADCNFNFPKPLLVGRYHNIKNKKKSSSGVLDSYKVTITKSAEIGLDVSGTEVVVEILSEKMFAEINEAIEKAAPKYSKR